MLEKVSIDRIELKSSKKLGDERRQHVTRHGGKEMRNEALMLAEFLNIGLYERNLDISK